jgi:hypothetical protein
MNRLLSLIVSKKQLQMLYEALKHQENTCEPCTRINMHFDYGKLPGVGKFLFQNRAAFGKRYVTSVLPFVTRKITLISASRSKALLLFTNLNNATTYSLAVSLRKCHVHCSLFIMRS